MGNLAELLPSGTEWWRMDPASLASLLAELEVLVRRAQAVQGEIIGEMDSRGALETFGYSGIDKTLIDVLHLSGKDANARVVRALACVDSTSVSGQPIPAPAPLTADAFAAGSIGAEHVDVIVAVLAAIPATVPPVERAGYERALVELGCEASPTAVRRAGRHVLALVKPDGDPPDDKDPVNPDRELWLRWTRDGELKLNGKLDTEAGQALEAALSPLTKPRPATDGTRDTRSAGHRNGDALAEMVGLVLHEGRLPIEAGERPHLVVTMTLDQLLRLNSNPTSDDAAQAACAPLPVLNWETPITAEQARLLACDAKAIPAVLGSRGEVVDLGRAVRTVTPAQRRWLALRDRGCCFHGCPRPVRWTQAHHLDEWVADDGPTDIANLCLLCSYHHRLIHHSGWEIVMAPDGIPECIPPAWLDPTRKPRRNRAHHTTRHNPAA